MKPGHMGAPDEACLAAREILSRVGDKWSVLVIGMLGDGPLRFNGLRKAIPGISQRMLTLTVRGLERDGLLSRTVTPTIPPRVDYALTGLGKNLLEVVSKLAVWAEKNRPKVETARARFDAANKKKAVA